MLDRGINRERILTLPRACDLGIVDARKLEVDPALKDRLARALREAVLEDGKPGDDEADFELANERLLVGAPKGVG